jgi:hypothetical protein
MAELHLASASAGEEGSRGSVLQVVGQEQAAATVRRWRLSSATIRWPAGLRRRISATIPATVPAAAVWRLSPTADVRRWLPAAASPEAGYGRGYRRDARPRRWSPRRHAHRGYDLGCEWLSDTRSHAAVIHVVTCADGPCAVSERRVHGWLPKRADGRHGRRWRFRRRRYGRR